MATTGTDLQAGRTARIACLGECMVELVERPDGLLRRFYGGDTLNTAIYLARLGAAVDYVTALGDDPWSDEMLASWRAEGVGTALVQRLANYLPGLYIVQTNADGERRFLHWRDSSAARLLFDHLDTRALAAFDVLYLSGITLSIYSDAARSILFQSLAETRSRGGRVVFDTNFRPRSWPDRTVARDLYARMFASADIVLASTEDLRLLYGETGEAELHRHAVGNELVLKLDTPASRVRHAGAEFLVRAAPVARVVDTTAAGDSFAAAYLAARLDGQSPEKAARAGHDLAGLVVGHAGAIVPAGIVPRRTPLQENV